MRGGTATGTHRATEHRGPDASYVPRPVILGRHPRMLELLDVAARLAAGDQPVLLHGATGTGKELLARLLHADSPRAGGPFRAVNCAALPPGLVEAELFGAARGAYTGADAARGGLFEAAHGGTLFLDEVGDMPAHLQAALLRVVEDGVVRRVGETRETRVDFRLVAATHRDLDAMVRAGTFRADLRWRLGHALPIPPLRERITDVPLMVRAFLEEWARGAAPPRVEGAAMAALVRHPFPGNVRELRARVFAAAALARDGLLRAVDFALPPSDACGGIAEEECVAAPRSLPPVPIAFETRAEDRILEALAPGGAASVGAIAAACRVPRRTVQRAVHDLVAGGRLVREGRGPGTRYRVASAERNG